MEFPILLPSMKLLCRQALFCVAQVMNTTRYVHECKQRIACLIVWSKPLIVNHVHTWHTNGNLMNLIMNNRWPALKTENYEVVKICCYRFRNREQMERNSVDEGKSKSKSIWSRNLKRKVFQDQCFASCEQKHLLTNRLLENDFPRLFIPRCIFFVLSTATHHFQIVKWKYELVEIFIGKHSTASAGKYVAN